MNPSDCPTLDYVTKSFKLTEIQKAEVEALIAEGNAKYAPIKHIIQESGFDAGPFFEEEIRDASPPPSPAKPNPPVRTVSYCSTRDKFPTQAHFGIWIFKRVQVADLYSKDRDALTEESQVEYRSYLDAEEWMLAIRELELRKESYRAAEVTAPARITVDVRVNIDLVKG